MKKLAIFALILTASIANAETIKPQEKVLFEKCVCSKNPDAYFGGCGIWTIKTTVTGIEWLDKELNTILFKGTSENNEKKAMEADMEHISEMFNDKDFDHTGAVIPKSCNEQELKKVVSNTDKYQNIFLGIVFKEQKGNSLVFYKGYDNCGYYFTGGNACEPYLNVDQIIIDIKTRKKKIKEVGGFADGLLPNYAQ